MKERYYSTVEYTDRFGKANRRFEIYADEGAKPTIGDYVDAFARSGMDVQITDFLDMIFKPTDPAISPLISLRVIRTLKDYS
ncbi:hypothetical protein IDH44_21340 [Paenibacillus sp. IB182496]|uniref:Uncharacterized protein n=1 Tax=Paenibacillus sabuli TaxID=2772509 RepID=A0A927BXV7_9BACL|nr:hypothetical protein [Paenibacillus sabuli]MBD2847745.1 hypothetical protein [Paenibacillus sabuli]